MHTVTVPPKDQVATELGLTHCVKVTEINLRINLHITRLLSKRKLQVVEAKDRIFEQLGAAPLCDNARVAADLTDARSLAEGLRTADFRPGAPSVFLAEGLIMYLKDGVEWKGKVGTDQSSY